MARRGFWLGVLLVACQEGADGRGDAEDWRGLDPIQKEERCDRIKAVSATRGVTNPLVVAGIANHESGLAQCWSEATWACQGPWSADCGGPTIAGSGDGACSLQQGGIGMFQLDGGTFAQTMATYGADVVEVAGNVDAGIDILIHKVKVCPNTPSFGSTQEVVDFINGAVPGTADYETFITAMAWCYNGCSPAYTSCNHASVRAAYKAGVAELRDLFGDEYWSSLPPPPGSVSSARSVGHNDDGRIEVFVRGTDDAVHHRWQLAPNEGFGGWSSLGGEITGEPVVAANRDGRLEVFAIAPDGAAYHRWQLGGGEWGEGWASLGGVALTGSAVGANADGRLELVVRSVDGQLWQKWQTAPSSAFVEDWIHMGTGIAGDPVLASNADGRLEVFARADDGSLRHAWQLEPDGTWSGWASLDGDVTGDPAVGRNADGRLEVFVTSNDGQVRHRWQETTGGWNAGWASLGGAGLEGTPAVASNADGRLEIVVRGWDGQLWHKWQTEPNRPFNADWMHFGEHTSADPQIGRNADGRLEVFVRGGDAALWHRWQLPPGDQWSGWAPLGGELASF